MSKVRISFTLYNEEARMARALRDAVIKESGNKIGVGEISKRILINWMYTNVSTITNDIQGNAEGNNTTPRNSEGVNSITLANQADQDDQIA